MVTGGPYSPDLDGRRCAWPRSHDRTEQRLFARRRWPGLVTGCDSIPSPAPLPTLRAWRSRQASSWRRTDDSNLRRPRPTRDQSPMRAERLLAHWPRTTAVA